MRTTVFEYLDGEVKVTATQEPDWKALGEYDGKLLERVRDVDVLETPQATMQLVEIGTGGAFAMHSSPHIAFCQIVRGRGKLGLPGGKELAYSGPELYVFLPETLHDWHDIEEDTLLSVCIVRAEA